MTNTMRILLLTCQFLPITHGQVYFLTGSPTPSYYTETFGSSLFRIESDGRVAEVAEIFPQSAGTDWIAISYEWRKIVVHSGPIVVIDFDKGGISKSCKQQPGD